MKSCAKGKKMISTMSLSLSFSLSEDLTPRRFYYGNCEAKRSVHPCFLQISCATCYPTSASDSRPPVSVPLRLPSTVIPSTSFSFSSSFLPSRQVDARRERALLMQHEKLASLSFITIERERKRKREGGRKRGREREKVTWCRGEIGGWLSSSMPRTYL